MEIKREEKILNKVLQISSIIISVAILTYTILNLKNLPDMVPSHFGFDGVIDGYMKGSESILIYIGIGIIMSILCNVVAIYPNKFLSDSKINENNKEKQYHLFSKFMRILGLEIIVIFSFFQYEITKASINGVETIGTSYIFILFIILISSILYEIKAKAVR